MLEPHEMSLDQLHAEVRHLRQRVSALELLVSQPLSEALIGGNVEILDQIHDAVILTDSSWAIRFWNRAAEELYGWPREEALGRSVGELIPVVRYLAGEEERAAQVELLRAAGRWRGEVVQRHRDGGELFVNATVQRVAAALGEPHAYLAINRDIGERLRAEAAHQRAAGEAMRALQASEERFRTVIEQSLDAVALTDQASIVHYISPAITRMLGYTPDELLGRPLRAVVDPAELQRIDPQLRRSRPGSPQSMVVQVRHKDGSGRWLEIARNDQTHNPAIGLIVSTVRDITAQKLAEDALRASEERLRTVTETARIGLAIVDREHRYQYANATYKEFLRLPPGDLVGQRVADVLGPLYEALLRQRLDRALKGELVSGYLAPPPPEGEMERRYAAWVQPGGDEAARVAVVVLSDITELIQAEAALHANEERLRLALQATEQALYDLHTPSGTATVSPEYASMLGYDPATFHESTARWVARLHPDDVAAATQAYRALLAGETSSFAVEFRERAADGRWVWLLSLGSLVAWDAEGRPLRMLGTRTNITALKEAEQARVRAVERLSLLAEASHAFAKAGADYNVVLDQMGRTVVAGLGDGCVIGLLADDAQRLVLHTLYDIDPELRAFHSQALGEEIRMSEQTVVRGVIRSGQPLFAPVIDREQLKAATSPAFKALIDRLNLHSLVMVPIEAQGSIIGILEIYRYRAEQPAFDADDLSLAQELAGRAGLAISNARLFQQAQAELAERRRAEQALEAERALLARRVAERTADLSVANAELARAARLKDEFLANMSHELRTPLNSILGRSEAIEEGIYGPVTAGQVTALQGIVESGHHLLTLINDILDLSKIESGRLSLERDTVDVHLVGTMALRMVAQMALVNRITLTSNFDAQVQLMVADERRLKQILVNLLSNAVKFTPQGGKVGLEVRGDPEKQSVTFTVWDTGIGIAADDLPRLFQPFVQIDSSLSREFAGTGLGLSLVSRLTNAHGGGVRVESAPGQGSRFSVTLPWSPEAQTIDRRAPPAKVDRSTPAFATALVVEDSSTAAAQITRYLRELGTRVEVHPHGTGAVERAIALKPDVIILDILLPDADGWAVLRQLKAEPQTRAIPVVVISVVDEPEQARTLGAAALLTKPIDRPGLVDVLRAVTGLRSEQPVQTTLVVSSSAQRPRVLLVEDNEATISAASDYLRAKGYEVIVARNGREAIVRAEEELPEVILMDIQMPGMDGLEAIRRLRAEPGMVHVPILAVTALAMPGDRERCLAAGADDYLTKPVQLRGLIAIIEAHRRRGAGQAGRRQT